MEEVTLLKRKTCLSLMTAVLALAGVLTAPRQASQAQTLDRKTFLPVLVKDYPLPPNVFGFGVDIADTSNGLNELVDTGVSWTRLPGLDWYMVEPTEGARNWSAVASLEQQLIDLSKRGIKVTLIIRLAPRWAQAIQGQFCGPVKPSKYSAMASFVRDAVARYSAAPYNVEYWEFGNEPDAPYSLNGQDNLSGFGCWANLAAPFANGEEYGRAMKVAYQAAKLANSKVQFMIGGLLMDCNPAVKSPCEIGHFFEGILRTVGGSFDGISYHAYDYTDPNLAVADIGKYIHGGWASAWNTTGPVLIVKGRFLKQKMTQYGISGKFLLNTETGLIGGPASAPGQCGPEPCELTKAYYVPQTYAAAIAEGLRGNLWYWLYGWRSSALAHPNGTKYKAYDALKFAVTTLGRPTYLGALSNADLGGIANVAGYKFNRSGTIVWVVWSRDGVARTGTLANAPDAIYDPFGASLGTSSVPVSIKPVYIVWNP
jgi:hypothetical protein